MSTPRGSAAAPSGGAAHAQQPCQAQTKRGTPCRSFALPAGDYCLAHDPERAGAVRAARAKGGAAASKVRSLQGRRAKLATVPELVRFTSGVIQDVLAGDVAPEVARAVLYGLSLQRQLVETSDLERRLRALEERA